MAARNKLLAHLHCIKRDNGWSDDEYRDILQARSGARSGADLDDAALARVVAALGAQKPGPIKPKSSRPLAGDPESRKIRALWLMLHELGAVTTPSEEALAAYVKRITRVDALQWINGQQAETLIESMKKWAMRFLPQAVEHLAHRARALPLSETERTTLAWYVSQARRGTFDPTHRAYEALSDVLKASGRD